MIITNLNVCHRRDIQISIHTQVTHRHVIHRHVTHRHMTHRHVTHRHSEIVYSVHTENPSE